MKQLIFVCMGNICRSPMAAGIMKQLLAEQGRTDWQVVSAGTHDYHVGHGPDIRALLTLVEHDIDIQAHKAQQLNGSMVGPADKVLVMDDQNYVDALAILPDHQHNQCEKLMQYHPEMPDGIVEDPYYADAKQFEVTYETCKKACEGVLKTL